MAVERIGLAGMLPELKQTYDRRLLEVALQNLVAIQYGQKKGIPARGGKSIEFRRFEKMVVGTHVLANEGSMPAETMASIGAVAATISQYGAWSKLSDLLEVQGFDPVVAEFIDAYAIHAAEVLDTVAFDELITTTTTQYAGPATVVGTSGAGAVGSGNYVSAAELLELRRTLRRNNARPFTEGGKQFYAVYVHPDNEKDLFEDPDIVKAFESAAPRAGDNPMFTGQLGDWMGLRFHSTTNLRLLSSYGMSGADVYHVVMCGQQAYGVVDLDAMQMQSIVHPRGSGGHTDPLEQYSTIGWKTAFATKILNNSWLGLLYCASSRSNSA